LDEADERFAEQVARALELGASLEDLGLAADEGYRRLLVDQCVLFGRSDDDLDLLETLHALYAAYPRFATSAERLETLGLVCGLIEQGETSSGALQPFIYMEDDLEVLSLSARELVRLYEADDGDDDLAGARFVRQLIDERQDDIQCAGLLRGLLLVGDPRIGPLVSGAWHLLGFGGQQRLAGSLGVAANPLTIAFLTEWLESAEGAERRFVRTALSQVAQAKGGGPDMSSIVLSDRFDRALVYATHIHAGQRRKGTGIPYVAHLLAVAALVLQNGGDEDQAIAALLHDAAEDHGGELRLADIRGRFGERVAAIVRACSDALPAPGEPKADWRPRKETYLAHLALASPDAVLVSAADKLDNARALLLDYQELGEALWGRFNAPRDGTLWYYREVVEVLERRLPGPLTRELADTVARLGQLVERNNAEPPCATP
jgi:5'-deoxynucleotidase YfbR-like HD superfamily hydrolase